MGDHEHTPHWKSIAAALVAMAALHVYIVLFAQNAFLDLAKPLAGPDITRLQPLLVTMSLGGIVGGVFAALGYSPERFRGLLAAGIVLCALAALAALQARTWWSFVMVAIWMGLSLGWLAVNLISGLRAVLGGERLGLWAGLSAGAGYGLCNLPWVATAPARERTEVALVLMLAALIGVARMRAKVPMRSQSPDYKWRGFSVWVWVFFVLVWLGSGTLFIAQNSTLPLDQSGKWVQSGNAVIFFIVAALAGQAFDRGWTGRTVLLSCVLLGVASTLIDVDFAEYGQAGMFYSAGVAIYSTAIVFYTSRSGRPWVTAILLSVSCWGGSALGIGMALELHDVPDFVMWVLTFTVVVALALRAYWRKGVKTPMG